MEVSLERGEATLELRNFDSVFDSITVPNSLTLDRPLGFVSGGIESLRIHWRGIQRMVSYSNSVTQFDGNYVENSEMSIAVTLTTPATKPPFTPAPRNAFRFVSDPSTTVNKFSQIGRERNGSFFPG